MNQEETAPVLESEPAQGLSPEDFIAQREKWEQDVEAIKAQAMQTLDVEALEGLRSQINGKIKEVGEVLHQTYELGDSRSWMDKILKRGMSLEEQQQSLGQMEKQAFSALDLIVERSQGDPWQLLGLQKEVAKDSLSATADLLIGLAQEERELSEEEVREVTRIGNELIEATLRRASGLIRTGGFEKVRELLETSPESAAVGVEKIQETMNELMVILNDALQKVLTEVVEQKKKKQGGEVREETFSTELTFGLPPRIGSFPSLSEVIDIGGLEQRIILDTEAAHQWLEGRGDVSAHVVNEVGRATGEWVDKARGNLHRAVEAHLAEAERVYHERQAELSAQMREANGDLTELVRLDGLSYRLSEDHVAHVRRTYDVSLEEQKKLTEWVLGIYDQVRDLKKKS